MDSLTCPSCQFSAYQSAFDWDGADEGDGNFSSSYTCPECGCRFDENGQEIASSGPYYGD